MKLRVSLAFTLGLAAVTAFAAPPSEESPPTDPPPLQLNPLRVIGRPITSFGLALRILAQPKTKMIERILVEDVTRDSDADLRGVRPGDEILRVDGRSVRTMVACFERASDLGRLFVNRHRGDRISLEILPVGARPRIVTLVQDGSTLSPWQLSEWP